MIKQQNILLCGVGGQGTVLASKLIAASAMAETIPVMSAETIGMAQKGGCVCSFIRLGGGTAAPMFRKGCADLLIAFEPAEGVRMLPYLKKGGVCVVNSNPIMPVTAALKESSYAGSEMVDWLRKEVSSLTVVDGRAACQELGSPKALNMVLLGAALASGGVELPLETVKKVMGERVKPQFYEMNCKALDYYSKKEEK